MNAVILFIIGIPLIEIYLMIKIGGVIGAFNTIFLIFFTAITGIYFARVEGLNTIRSVFGQIIRNEVPEITNFFILHEGPIGVFNSELVEKDYDDIQDKSYSTNADRGFCGITDKFWITSLIPQENRKFRADFDYKNKFRKNTF